MSHAETPIVSSIIAVNPDHGTAERAVRQLHDAGFALGDLSIVGRDFQETGRPYGFVTRGDCSRTGAETGAWFGGLFGIFIRAGFLVLPGLGLVVVAGPIAAALVAALEGGVAGTALGGRAGALIGWDFPEIRALKYEREVKAGKFLVIVRGKPEVISKARKLLTLQGAEQIEVNEPPAL